MHMQGMHSILHGMTTRALELAVRTTEHLQRGSTSEGHRHTRLMGALVRVTLSTSAKDGNAVGALEHVAGWYAVERPRDAING